MASTDPASPLMSGLAHRLKTNSGSWAAQELEEMGAAAVPALLGVLGEAGCTHAATHVLRRIGEPAVEPLLQLLKDPERSGLHVHAAFALVGLKDDRVVEPLILALQDGREDVRSTVAAALASQRDPRALGPLLAAFSGLNLDEPAVGLGAELAEAFAEFGDSRAIEPLIRLVGRASRLDQGLHDRDLAVCALVKLGGVDALTWALRSPSCRGSRWIAKTLGELKDPKAVEPLLAVARPRGSYGAVMALGEIGDVHALDQLLDIAVDRDWDEPDSMKKALVALGAKSPDHFRLRLAEIVRSSQSLRARRYAAELVVRAGQVEVDDLLPAIILDWISAQPANFAMNEEGLQLMCEVVGLDSTSFALGRAAIGAAYTQDDRSSRTYPAGRQADDFKHGCRAAVVKLCRTRGVWSSCLLYRVVRRVDVDVQTGGWGGGYLHPKRVGFDAEREMASKELKRRRWREDPVFQLQARIKARGRQSLKPWWRRWRG